jgi:hypothetical protein
MVSARLRIIALIALIALVSIGLVSIGLSGASHAVTIHVLPGVNNVPITQVICGIPGSPDVVPTTSQVGVTGPLTDTAVIVKSVQVNNRGLLVDLNFVNTMGAMVTNMNPALDTIPGIGVFNHGVTTPSNGPGGLTAYTSALESTASDFDLGNFAYYDDVPSGSPTSGVPDYDILYAQPMAPTDYLLVSERNGNTYFEVTALKQDGTP